MIKLFSKDTLLFETNEQFASFDIIKSPFKEILKKEDYSSFSFAIKDDDEKIEFSEIFILQVNIKDSASLVCSFPLENLNKNDLINRVSSLKNIKVLDLESSKHKTEELLKIVKDFKPYFLIYQAKNGFPLYENELQELLTSLEYDESVNVFFIFRNATFDEIIVVEEKKEEQQEEVTKVDVPQEEKKEKGSKKPSQFKNYLVMDLENIKKNRYHFIFLVVSSFLFGFASSVGFCNAMIGKLITILFFVCAAVGLFLDTYVYLDFFRERKIKDRLFPYSVLFNVLGIGFAIGATMLFYYFDNTGVKEMIDVTLLAGVGIAMSFGSVIISIAIAFIAAKLERKYKTKKLEPKAPIEPSADTTSEEQNVEAASQEETSPIEEGAASDTQEELSKQDSTDTPKEEK